MSRRHPRCGLLVVACLTLLGAGSAAAALGDGYVGCSTSNDVHPFDPVTLAEGGRIDLMPSPAWYPYDATMKPDGTEVWLVGASGDEIAIIDMASDVIVDRVPVGEYPVSIEFSLDGSLAFVGCRDSLRLDVVDVLTRTLVSSLPLPDQGGQIGVDPLTGLLYVAAWYDGEIWEISADGSSLLRTLVVGSSLWSVRVARDGSMVYVTDRGDDLVRVIDVASLTETATVAVGDDPWGLDLTADGRLLVVTCEDSSEIRIIDTSDLSQTAVPLDATADPRDVDIHEGLGEAFICGGRVGPFGSEQDLVYVLDLATLTLVRSYDSAGANTNVIAVWPGDPVDCGPDSDGDGVGDACDLCPGSDDALDGDGDGVPDGCDVCPGGDDALDGDGDGVPDDCDRCPGGDDAADADGDGVADACDPCPFDPSNADADGDGVCDDGDGSGVAGDAPCLVNDSTPAPGCDDNCPGASNAGDPDGDADGAGDACDLCPGEDDRLDRDADAVPDGCDNCPDIENPGQEDRDGNGIGDACDLPPGCMDPPEVTGLRVEREGADLLLTFDAIDPALTDAANLHAGTLDSLGAGSYDHGSEACALTLPSHRISAAIDGIDRYYLVAGTCALSGEGSYGRDSLGGERPTTGDLGLPSCP